MLSRTELIASLLDAVKGVQVASGRPSDGIHSSSHIFGDIDGFDSLNALEMLVTVGTMLNNELPDELLAPMTDGSWPTVSDLADRILAGGG